MYCLLHNVDAWHVYAFIYSAIPNTQEITPDLTDQFEQLLSIGIINLHQSYYIAQCAFTQSAQIVPS